MADRILSDMFQYVSPFRPHDDMMTGSEWKKEEVRLVI